jgi:cytochrome P450
MHTPIDETPFAHFDHNADQHRAGAECTWARMRETPGLPYSSSYGGFYIVTRYADIAIAASKPELFSSAQGIAIPDLHFDSRLLPLETDPPIQQEYRKLLVPFLTRERISRKEPEIRAIAQTLLADFVRKKRIDFVHAFAKPFPSRVALNVLGFPAGDALHLDALINDCIDGRGSEKAATAGHELVEYIENFLVRQRMAPANPEDIISVVAHATIGGKPLEHAEQNSVVKLLLFGGFTTTTFALSSAFKWLAEHPDDRVRLQKDPSLLRTAVEDFVRFASPGTYLARTVVADTQLGGTQLRAGDRILMCFGSANRDQSAFVQPDEVKLDRTPNRHMGFGYGTHGCMGLHLARLELRIAFEVLLVELVDFELDPAAEIRWASGETQGMTTLPLVIRRVASDA